MKVSYNPFPVRVYYGKSTFCDRFMELERLTENAKNQINTTLFSIRRMGKTGLIYRFFDDIKEKNEAKCVYVDVFSTQSQLEFTNILATSILKVFPQSKFIGRKFIDFIKGFSPVISYDPLSGVPQIEFSFTNPQQQEITLRSLLYFLDQQKKTIIVAIDEFQQIAHYPEKNTESLLRTLIQELKNVMFIFSGSHQHLLTEIFHQAKRPFFFQYPTALSKSDR